MKPTPFYGEVLYVPGGLTTRASFSVDPHEDPEDARREAARRSKRAGEKRRLKRRKLEKRAAKATAATS